MIYYSEKKLSRIQNTNQVLDSNAQSPNPQTHQRIVENQQYEDQQRIRNMQMNQYPQNPGNQQVFAENRNIPNQPAVNNPQYPMGIPPTYPPNPTPVLPQIVKNPRTVQPQYASQAVRSSAIGMNVHQTYPVVPAQALNEEEKLPNIHNRTVSIDNPMNSTNIGLHLLANQYIDQEEQKAPAGSPQQLNHVQTNSGNPELNQMRFVFRSLIFLIYR